MCFHKEMVNFLLNENMDNLPIDLLNPIRPSVKKGRGLRRFLRVVVVLVGLLVIARIVLPYVALRLINSKLAALPEFNCVVNDLDLHLLDRSFTLKNIVMTKRNGKIPVVFFTSNKILVRVESWEHRATEIVVDSCVLNMVNGKTKETSQFFVNKEWIEFAKQLPLKPNTFEVKNGELHYIESGKYLPTDLSLKKIKIRGDNLENIIKVRDTLPSRIVLNSELEGTYFKALIKLDKSTKNLVVKCNASHGPVKLKRVRNILKKYTMFDVQEGTLSASTHFTIRNKRIKGQLVPIIKDAVFFNEAKKKDKQFFQRLKEGFIKTGLKIFENHKTGEIKAEVEVDSPLKKIKFDVKQIIIDAFSKSLQDTSKQETKNDKKKARKKKKRKK